MTDRKGKAVQALTYHYRRWELARAKAPWGVGRRDRIDTRRRNAAGKLIGGKTTRYGCGPRKRTGGL